MSPVLRRRREWVTFADPVDEAHRWRVDVTFLTSSWRCIFGAGCQGVLTAPAPELEQGCCSYGAHLVDDADRARVEAAAARLTGDEWQLAARGRRLGVFARLPGGGWRTRVVDGACVFLNRPTFAEGAGCALHLGAIRSGCHPHQTKPDVCWQLPLRRTYETDEEGVTISVLSEFGRSGWGDGGADFAWWCTEAPAAYTAAEPVYRSLEPELRAMVGDAVYTQIAAYLDDARHPGSAGRRRHPDATSVTLGTPGG
ncbi:MAG: hypothetical protein ACRDY7_09380 [Acidimicrobiia bacterium]